MAAAAQGAPEVFKPHVRRDPKHSRRSAQQAAAAQARAGSEVTRVAGLLRRELGLQAPPFPPFPAAGDGTMSVGYVEPQ